MEKSVCLLALLVYISYTTAQVTWSNMTSTSLLRNGAGCPVGTSNHIVVVGGGYHTSSSNASRFVEFYNVTSKARIATYPNQLNIARSELAATNAGGFAIFLGGYNGSTISGRVDLYHENNTWSTHNVSPRSSLAATSVGGRAFFAGGQFPLGVPSAIVDIFESTTERWSNASLSRPRYNLCACSAGGLAFFIGGTSLSGTNFETRVDFYDINSNIWSTMDMALPRESPACIGLLTRVYVAGGMASSRGVTDTVVIYDILTKTWSEGPTLSYARDSIAVGVSGLSVLFAGGSILGNVRKDVDILHWNGTKINSTFLSSFRSNAVGVSMRRGGIFAQSSLQVTTTDFFSGCENCISGFEPTSFCTCSRCPRYCERCLNAVCFWCMPQFYLAIDNTCQACSWGCRWCNSSTSCMQCLPGLTLSNGICTGRAWGILPPLAPGRRNPAAIALTSQFTLIAGGIGDSAYTTSIDLYNLDLRTRTPNWANLTSPRRLIATTKIGNLAIFFGGENQTSISTRVEMFQFIPNLRGQGEWSSFDMPIGRTRVAAVTVGSRAIFAGGMSDLSLQTPTNRVDIYDDFLKQWNVHYLNESKYDFCGCSVGQYAFFGGGDLGSDIFRSNKVEKYDILRDQWSVEKFTLNPARSKLACASLFTTVFFAGGMQVASPTARVEHYDIFTGLTGTLGLSTARSDLSGVTVGRNVIFAGGLDANGPSAQVDIITFELRQSSGVLNVARSMPTAISIGRYAMFPPNDQTNDLVDLFIGCDSCPVGFWPDSACNCASGDVLNCEKYVNSECFFCRAGFYLDSGLCSPCVGNCIWCVGNTNCSICALGYTPVGSGCQDIDECASNSTFSCPLYSHCRNTLGSYVCDCDSGFFGSNGICTDIDECENETPCVPEQGTCVNIPGSFFCECKIGFHGRYCETNPDDCELSSCGGYPCIDGLDTFYCEPGLDRNSLEGGRVIGDKRYLNSLSDIISVKLFAPYPPPPRPATQVKIWIGDAITQQELLDCDFTNNGSVASDPILDQHGYALNATVFCTVNVECDREYTVGLFIYDKWTWLIASRNPLLYYTSFFPPLPSPTNNTLRFYNEPATPGGITLSVNDYPRTVIFNGNHFCPAQMTLSYSGMPSYVCVIDQFRSNSTSIVCDLPKVTTNDKSKFYRLDLQTALAVVRMSDEIGYLAGAKILSISACNSSDVPPSCDTTGGIVTIVGSQFEDPVRDIKFNEYTCDILSTSINSTGKSIVTCQLEPGIGRTLTASVFVRADIALGVNSLAYKGPSIYSISSPTCNQSLPSHVRCARQGGDTITLRGTNFGPNKVLGTVFIGSSICLNLNITIPHEELTCVLPPGKGSNLLVRFLQGGSLTVEEITVSYSPCPAGFFAQPGNSIECEACGVGKYSPIASDEMNCLPCPEGRIAPTSGTQECQSCSPGYESVNRTTCIACTPGKAKGINETVCTNCPPGRFANSSAQETCVECQRGSITPTSGQTECTKCLRGKFFLSPTECQLCPDRSYNLADGQETCIFCDGDVGESRSFCNCPLETYFNNSLCKPCPIGGICTGGPWEEVTPQNEYFRVDGMFILCPVGGYCKGQNCSLHRTGLFCAFCEEGFYDWGGKCIECPDGSSLIVLFLLVAWVYVIIIHLLAGRKSSRESKILFYFISSAKFIINSQFTWLSYFNILSYDPEQGGVCLAPLSPYSKLIFQLFLPFIMLCQLFFTGIFHRLKLKYVDGKNVEKFWNPYIRSTLALGIFTYTHITNIVLNYLDCEQYGDYTLVKSIPAMSCTSGEYKKYLPLIVTFLIFPVITYPMILAGMLYRHRELLHHPETGQLSELSERFGPVYETYKTDRYWWEVVAITRRSGLVVISVITAARLEATQAYAVFCLLVLTIHQLAKPFSKDDDNRDETISLVGLTLVAILQTTSDDDTQFHIQILTAIIVVPIFTWLVWSLGRVKVMNFINMINKTEEQPTSSAVSLDPIHPKEPAIDAQSLPGEAAKDQEEDIEVGAMTDRS